MEPLKLPLSIIGQVDISRMQRELAALNDFFVGANARMAGTSMQLPRLTRLLDQLAQQNNVNLLEEADRGHLLAGLDDIAAKAPSIHISFASEPSPKALERILVWLRQNVHPQVLLQVGLQPGLSAGCELRTPNRIFDMSLRKSLKKQERYLLELIVGAARE